MIAVEVGFADRWDRVVWFSYNGWFYYFDCARQGVIWKPVIYWGA